MHLVPIGTRYLWWFHNTEKHHVKQFLFSTSVFQWALGHQRSDEVKNFKERPFP